MGFEHTCSGIFASQQIQQLIDAGAIRSDRPIDEAQLQPASLDLRLGSTAYHLPASILPGPGRGVIERIETLGLATRLDLSGPVRLERNQIYLIALEESLRLPQGIRAKANPKSSIGRVDLFTRLLADEASDFDYVPDGYHGPLYVEVCPRTFDVVVQRGLPLNQLRIFQGDPRIEDWSLQEIHDREPLVFRDGAPAGADIEQGLWVTADLLGTHPDAPVAYRARPHGLVDLSAVRAHNPDEFWEPIAADPRGILILEPNEFYILVSREQVRIPPLFAAEMVAYEPSLAGRVHYAGFFDPGFGHAPGVRGSRGVLEVRANEVPFLLEHGQRIARLVYEPMIEEPIRLYGRDIGSNYQGQGLKLSKHFRDP